MKRITRLLNGNKLYLKSLAILTSGSVIALLINAVFQILQTRIFTENDIGVYTYLMAIPLMFTGVTALRYDCSSVVEGDDRKALALVKLSMIVSLVVSAIVTIGYIIYTYIVDALYREYLIYSPLIFFMLVGYGANNTLNAYNNRQRDYAVLSSAHVWRTLMQRGGAILLGALFVVLLGYQKYSILIMMATYCLGVYAGLGKQFRPLLNDLPIIQSITSSEMIDVAREYRRQPIYSTPALFMNSFSFSIITIILEKLFGSVSLAYYSVSSRVLAMPISVISTNVSKIFVENASKEYEATGNYKKSFKKSLIFLSGLAIPLLIMMYCFAPIACGWLFGEGWQTAGEYIRILSLMFAFRLVATALSQVLIVGNKQGTELCINIALTLASAISGVVTVICDLSIQQFLLLLSLSRSLCYFILIILVWHYSKGNIKQ